MGAAGYDDEAREAVCLMLSLGLGAVVDLLSRFTSWNRRIGTVRGLHRQEWILPMEYIEVGGAHLDTTFGRAFERIEEAIGQGERWTGVTAMQCDMRRLPVPDDFYDFAVWDPPYYDNIDYDAVAAPWTESLRMLLGDAPAGIDWALSGSNLQGDRFDEDAYLASLSQTAAELDRALKAGANVGIFWILKSNDDQAFTDFLHLVESVGFELIEAFALKDGESSVRRADGPKPLILVFRKAPLGLPSDADAILAGAANGRPLKIAGLVEVLREHLADDELEELIEPGFKGSLEERLTETIYAMADPRSILSDLRQGELRRSAVTLGLDAEVAEAMDASRLTDEIFHLLGWKVPSEPPFSIGKALDAADRYVNRSRLSSTREELKGALAAALDEVEFAVRFMACAWAQMLNPDDPPAVLEVTVGKRDRLSFGDWKSAASQIPKAHREDVRLERVVSPMKKAKFDLHVSRAVKLRNQIKHPENPDWTALTQEVAESVAAVKQCFARLEEKNALPRALQPLREIRDPFGRITLRLLAHAGHHIEFFLTEPIDLTRAVVLIPGPTNPREVDPTCLSAADVMHLAKVPS